MLRTKVPKERSLLERLLKAGMISENEYSFANEVLDNKRGEM